MEASLRHSSGRGTCSVSPQYRDLRTRVLACLKAGDASTRVRCADGRCYMQSIPHPFMELTLDIQRNTIYLTWFLAAVLNVLALVFLQCQHFMRKLHYRFVYFYFLL